MDFELSQDQRDLQGAIASLLEGVAPLETVRRREGAADTIDPEIWSQLRDAGVFGLLVDEEHGGVGLARADATLVFEELGAALIAGPLASTTALAPSLDAAANGVPHGLVETTSAASASPVLVEHPGAIEAVVVIAPIGQPGPLRVVPRAAVGTAPVDVPLDPLTPMAVITSGMEGGDTLASIDVELVRQTTMVLIAAQQVGIASRVVTLATEYAKGREQFGRPIGGFQAIKHLLADALVRAEVARAAVHAAAVMIDDPDVAAAEGDTVGLTGLEARWRAVAGAKLIADDAAVANARTAIQVYGGMGFTWEVPMHLYVKRARLLSSTFGTKNQLADALSALI